MTQDIFWTEEEEFFFTAVHEKMEEEWRRETPEERKREEKFSAAFDEVFKELGDSIFEMKHSDAMKLISEKT